VAEDCRRILEIEVPQDVVKKRVEGIVAQLQRRVRLPGFRPGKAPVSLVRQRFRDDIRSELLRELIPEYVEAQAREHKWDAVGNPAVSDVEYAEDSPLKFKATLEVLPEIELKDYGDLEIEVEETAVSEEEVEKTLAHLQEEGATYVNLESRPLQDGDYASIAVKELLVGGESPVGKTHEALCEIGGPQTIKEFTENLRGATLGEERSYDVSYPSDFNDPRIAGKTVSYHVKVLGLKKKQLPELNDDFARELGNFDSLDSVRQRIREDMEKAKRRESDQNAKSQLREKLARLHDFPVPEVMVERQIERRLDAVRRQIESKGMNPRSLQVDWGKVRAAQREAAVEDVKSGLILEKIAQENNMEVEEADLQKEIQEIVAATNQAPEVVEAHLTKDGGLDRIKSRLRIDKSLEFVLLNVRRTKKSRITGEKED